MPADQPGNSTEFGDGVGQPSVGSAAGPVAAKRQELRTWVERIKEAEKLDREFGLYIPGDSALAVVFNGMEEAAYAGDPEFDSRVRP